ncbi:MAG: response regulator transcription factor [Anaerolineales bacterium]|nr:response regulator transcription factor [Anaerolineales bacterium]
MAPATILVIDDEPSILNLIQSYLQAENFEVLTARDGREGLTAAKTHQPDLVILDIMLPGMDGIQVLQELRRDSDVYVIMLTAKTEETDRVIGLSVGADDYVTKPFSPRELVARVKAALRRIQGTRSTPRPEIWSFRDLTIDISGRQVRLDDQPVDLTSTEFDILQALVEHRGMVLSREQLTEKVWGNDFYGELRVVDVHIGHIRQKIGEEFIATVRGVGYRFQAEDQ